MRFPQGKSYFFFVLLFAGCSAFSQSGYELLNHSVRSLNDYASQLHTDSTSLDKNMYPRIYSEFRGNTEKFYNTYIPQTEKDSLFLMRRKYKERSWFIRKLLYENFIIIDTGQLYITIDPLINVSVGAEQLSSTDGGQTSEKQIYNNTRGLLIRADIGKKFSMETYVYENQIVAPTYIDTFISTYGVVPGQGRVKQFYNKGYDFSQAGAYFSYAPWKEFNVQFGHHKHFIGDGYRSLILSDHSFNYPFLRLNFNFWKNRISYAVLYASFQNLDRLPITSTSEAPFYRKGGAFHVVNFSIAKWVNFNLFQGTIWKTMNKDGHSDFNLNMWNPVIFTSVLFSDASNFNSVFGVGFNFKPIKNLKIYMSGYQRYNENRNAYQFGTSYFVTKTLRVQAEFNQIASDFYGSDTLLSYTHYNQSVAHPMGSGFNEVIFKVNYRYRRFLSEAQFNLSSFNRNGQDVFSGKFDDVPGGDYFTNRKQVVAAKIELAYLLNPSTNLKIFANYTIREETKFDTSNWLNSSNFYYFGIRTDLRNIYYDF